MNLSDRERTQIVKTIAQTHAMCVFLKRRDTKTEDEIIKEGLNLGKEYLTKHNSIKTNEEAIAFIRDILKECLKVVE